MKGIVLNRPVTLVGVGCSHTQGCAFTKGFSNRELHWASPALEEKYNRPCTSDYITNNLTWMAKLKKYINVEKIINFGFGGMGTTSSLRSVRNYITKKESLIDHLFIFQLQSTFRNEVTFHYTDEIRRDSMRHFISYSPPLFKKEYLNFFATYLVDEQTDTYDYILELYYLQNILEKLGAQVRIFYNCFYSPLLIEKEKAERVDKSFNNFRKTGYEKKLIDIPKFDKIVDNLNIIDLEGVGEKMVPRPSLHNEGLLENDWHLSEKGNEIIAEFIFKNFNNKPKSNIFQYEILS